MISAEQLSGQFLFFFIGQKKIAPSQRQDHFCPFFATPTRLLKPIWLLEYAGFCHFKHKIDPHLYIN